MKLIKVIDDVAILNHNGFVYIAAIDCFEGNNHSIGAYINDAGLPMLIVRNSIPGALINTVFKDEGLI